jgi:small subunit ribosomal protein S18
MHGRSSSMRRRRGGPRRGGPRRKVCRFCESGELYIDYMDWRRLRDFVSERGKIVPRRISGTCARHQRMLSQAIKRARFMALISFVRK